MKEFHNKACKEWNKKGILNKNDTTNTLDYLTTTVKSLTAHGITLEDVESMEKTITKQSTKLELHKQILDELHETYQSKNSDYGDSFGETFEKLGIVSSVTRIADKTNRLVSLVGKKNDGQKVLDETIEDTLLDCANYCIMTAIELRKEAE